VRSTKEKGKKGGSNIAVPGAHDSSLFRLGREFKKRKKKSGASRASQKDLEGERQALDGEHADR